MSTSTARSSAPSTRRTIALCCLLGGLVLLGFAVLNASQTPPETAAAWVEGLLGVALLGAGLLLRRSASALRR